MNLTDFHITIFSSLGIIPAFILLIFPHVNYIIKAISTALIGTYLGCISIIFFGWNIAYISDDNSGIFFFISFVCGVFISICGGLAIIAIFLFKNEKSRKIISKIFKNNQS